LRSNDLRVLKVRSGHSGSTRNRRSHCSMRPGSFIPGSARCCVFLLYTGCRFNEGLKLEWARVELDRGFAYVGKTKNGQPRAVHLPPQIIAALMEIRTTDTGKVFRFAKSGWLYNTLDEAANAAGIEIPPGVAFHVFRHTFGAWMRHHAGLDASGLVATGAWKSRAAAPVYEHADVTTEARKADLLPTPTWLNRGYDEGTPQGKQG
jgi:integrase